MAKLARRYLAHRRGFGYRLQKDAYYLTGFARFMDRISPGQPLTTKLALQWARRKKVLPRTVAKRLSAIRGFARFCATLDERTEVPPGHLTHCRGSRQAQHIFTDAQVRLILQRTDTLRSVGTNLRPITFRTLIGLLACTGLRPSEAFRLRDVHFNAAARTLSVPSVKRSPERTIPLHPSTVRALQYYQRIRRARFQSTDQFFVGPFGRPLGAGAAGLTFSGLVRDIPGNGSCAHPRLYDFRHSFATKMIARWSKQSVPLRHHLVLLSRYLGHEAFHQTYWYVGPDLPSLQCAAARFERYRHSSTLKD
jgi:integrase